MTFYRWLMLQLDRCDPVGDFARDVKADKPHMRTAKMPCGNFKTTLPWERYLRASGGDDGSVEAMKQAFAEYRKEMGL